MVFPGDGREERVGYVERGAARGGGSRRGALAPAGRHGPLPRRPGPGRVCPIAPPGRDRSVTHRRLTLAACLLAVPPAPAAREVFTPHHVARLRSVTAAEVSPDGRHVAYLLNVPRDLAREKDGTACSELHVIDVKGRPRASLTGQVTVTAPAWTP